MQTQAERAFFVDRGGEGTEEKQRIIQEFVPGKQVTLAHLIANPVPALYEKLGLEPAGAIGILTLTPSETVMIAADLATKAATVEIGFLDRFTGALVIVGSVADVETALREIGSYLSRTLGYATAEVTRS
ncbi:MAG: ethanolamine utilization microcompartment protein EutS [Symbiobacteriia bacterium]